MTADKPTTPKPPGKPVPGVKSSFQRTEMFPETSSGEPQPTPNEAANALQWMGKTLGKYQIIDMLGQGGMGIVFKAHDPAIERDVAIKLLPEDVAADDNALRRFREEAKVAGKLNHPNIVSIYEIGQEGNNYYLVMELVPGGSADDGLIKHGAFSVLDATRMLIDACKGLSAAHAAGMIHRDIKPANLMRTADGVAKLTDFGLAKALSNRTQQLTQTGMVVGTPYFMSPEQCEARAIDTRSDIYSLGASYYNLLTGRNPYEESESVMQIMYAHCHGQVPDPRAVSPAIPPACSAIVARAMAKAPADRYQSAAQMQADLEAVAATLSGHRGIELPSQSGLRQPVPASIGAGSGGGSWQRGVLLGAGMSAVVLLVALILWRPWERSGGDPNPGILPPQGEPINVGVLHSLSGTMADSESVLVDAYQLAREEINRAGGLLGRPVEMVVADGRSDAAIFARQAEKLIAQDKVCTVFGCWTSESRKTVKPIFEKHDHLLVYPLQYEGLEESPNIIYMGAAPNQQILPAVKWAVTNLKKKKFFLVGSDYVFPRAAHEIIKDYVKSIGAQVVGAEYLPLGSAKVDAMVRAIVKAEPDMILNTINGDSNIAFFRELRAAGISASAVPCLSFSIGEEGLRSLKLADMQGDYAAWSYFQSLDTPQNKEFLRKFQERFPQRSITDPTESAYVGMMMWARAVQEAGSLEPKRIRRAMLTQKFDAPGGPTRIDPDTQHSYKTPRVGRINSEGRFDIVWSAAEPVAPEPYPASRTAAAWRAFLHDLYTGWGNHWAAPTAK